MRRSPPLAALLAVLAACASHQTDPESRKNALQLKAESLAMLVRASEPPENHIAEIGALQGRLDDAVRYERSKRKPTALAREWSQMADPKGGLVGTFLEQWMNQGTGLAPETLHRFGDRIG